MYFSLLTLFVKPPFSIREASGGGPPGGGSALALSRRASPASRQGKRYALPRRPAGGSVSFPGLRPGLPRPPAPSFFELTLRTVDSDIPVVGISNVPIQ